MRQICIIFHNQDTTSTNPLHRQLGYSSITLKDENITPLFECYLWQAPRDYLQNDTAHSPPHTEDYENKKAHRFHRRESDSRKPSGCHLKADRPAIHPHRGRRRMSPAHVEPHEPKTAFWQLASPKNDNQTRYRHHLAHCYDPQPGWLALFLTNR